MRILMAVMVAGTAMIASAQDTKKDDCCAAMGICCPKDGKCEGVCRQICNRVGETLKAVRAQTSEQIGKSKKMSEKQSACLSGACSAKGCPCAQLLPKVFAPALKAKVSAWMEGKDRNLEHEVKDAEGKTAKVACTFLAEDGKPCPGCVEQLTADCVKKLTEAKK